MRFAILCAMVLLAGCTSAPTESARVCTAIDQQSGACDVSEVQEKAASAPDGNRTAPKSLPASQRVFYIANAENNVSGGPSVHVTEASRFQIGDAYQLENATTLRLEVRWSAPTPNGVNLIINEETDSARGGAVVVSGFAQMSPATIAANASALQAGVWYNFRAEPISPGAFVHHEFEGQLSFS